jgi:hypothetical protein
MKLVRVLVVVVALLYLLGLLFGGLPMVAVR